METKQVIVMRKDLGMRKGKMIAQGCHSSMKVFFDRMTRPNFFSDQPKLSTVYSFNANEEMIEWIEGKFTKICVSVDSEGELFKIHHEAQQARLPVALIQDAGKTEFSEPTYTCLAIGPDEIEKIDKITGHLPLL